LTGLAVTEHGDVTAGPPLVLLHAFPLDATMWDALLPALTRVARVVTVDLPGFGASPPAAGPPSMDACADAVAAVLDELGAPRAVLVGCSMGGYVALATACRHPGRLAGLGLVDTKAEADGEQARANRERIAQAVTGEAGGRALLPMLETLLGPDTLAHRLDVVERLRALLLAAPPSAVAWAQRAMAGRRDSTDLLAGLAVPAAVVVGADDAVTGPALAGAMAGALPDAVLTVVPRCGHLSPIEQPDAVAAALVNLIVRLR
jgi:pimeloyl-ACP methyl ester carboxylesterase